MVRLMNRLHRQEKGFTLVELMIVVVIIGILVGIAMMLFSDMTGDAADNAHKANIRVLRGAAQMAIAENGTPTGGQTWPDEESGWANSDDYVDEWPDVPDAANEGDANSDSDNQVYEVVIDSDGNVVVNVTTGGTAGE